MIRLFDITLSIFALLFLCPVLLVLAIVIRLETAGSPIFRQERVGQYGKIFKINKFRSMVSNAPQLGGYATRPGDTRITRVGRIIRATSMDELPQLWNVLIGDMSLVGPRPDVLAQRELYEPVDWEKRLSVRPGVTGLAQIKRRSSATAQERLEQDLVYVDQRSLSLNLKLLIMTVRLVLTKLAH